MAFKIIEGKETLGLFLPTLDCRGKQLRSKKLSLFLNDRTD